MQVFEEEKQAVIDAKERPETVNFLVHGSKHADFKGFY